MRRLLILLISTGLLSLAPDANANSNVGTSGAQFLKIGAGARPTAMGNAFVGIADDANAPYFNPAGLTQLTRSEFTAMHTQWFQGLNYQYGSFVLPTKIGHWGISAATLKAEDFEKRGNDESLLGRFDSQDAYYAISYGNKFNSWLSWGITTRYINQEIDTASAGTWSGDFGLFSKFETLPITLGFAVRHLGPEIEFNEESDPQPTTIDLGAGYRLMEDRLLLGLSLTKPRDNDLQVGTGLEWNQQITKEHRFLGRFGYNSLGTDADGASGLSFGAGLGYKDFTFDFAWTPFGDLGDTFRYTIDLKF